MNLLGYVHRVGSRLFLDNDHAAFFTVIVSLLGTLFDAVFNAGNITQIDSLVIFMTDHKIVHLMRIRKFTLYTERIGVGTDIHAATWSVPVFLCDDSGYSFD